MASADTPPAPAPQDPGKDLQNYVKGLSGALPSLSALEGQYRPNFGALNLQDISGFLTGVNGQAGIYQIGSQANQQAQAQLNAARQSEFANQQANTGAVRGILQGLNQEGYQQVQNQNNLANQAYQEAQGVSPQQARTADQQSRAAFASRGRVGDNSAVASEILGRQEVLQANRDRAATLSGQAGQAASSFYSPGTSMLSGAPASILLGQDYLNRGQTAVGANTPQLIDTGVATSVGAANAANQANWQSNVASINNANKASNTQAGVSAAAAIAGLALAFSDRKVKKNVKKVGKTDSGLPIYTYQYKGSPKTQMGVMAQDVEKKNPKAVHSIGGTKAVNYADI